MSFPSTESPVSMEALAAYIPIDRRWALATGQKLPSRTSGSVLFLDISGFTALTDQLVDQLGERRGVDELTLLLNEVYGALITEVHQYGGSVIGFSGDAITCWFNQTLPFLPEQGPNLKIAALRATTCALVIQQMMARFDNYVTRSGIAMSLGIKAAIASGPVRRFLVGDPVIQYIDVLAGNTLDRMAAAEKIATKGEVVLEPNTATLLESHLAITKWRPSPLPQEKRHFAIISSLKTKAEATPWPTTTAISIQPLHTFTETEIRAWLLPLIYERFQAGQDQFLAELRRTYPLFVLFDGINYGNDDAEERLNSFVVRVQQILHRYGGYLIQLTTGDKGTYLYGCFGAPISHADDATRAVTAAITLRQLSPDLGFITSLRIGLSQGRMRSGPCGNPARLTYGVLGDEVNIAARLMELAEPDQILVSQRVADAIETYCSVDFLRQEQLRGRDKPVAIFTITDQQIPRSYRVGDLLQPTLNPQDRALARLKPIVDNAVAGHGQVLYLEGDLTSQHNLNQRLKQAARSAQFQVIQANLLAVEDGPQVISAYGPWSSVFWHIIGVGSENNIITQIGHVARWIEATNPDWLRLMPLLGDLLMLAIPDNDTTAIFDVPLLRRGATFAVTLEILQLLAQQKPLLITIPHHHPNEATAQRLTLALARILPQAAILLVIINTPTSRADSQLRADLAKLAAFKAITFPFDELDVAIDSGTNPESLSVLPAQTRPYLDKATKLIGRETELNLLRQQLHQLQANHKSGITFVEGEAGIGKSRLVSYLLSQSTNRTYIALIGAADAIEQSTPYYAWRPIFRQFFKLDTLPDNAEARATHVLAQLPAATNPELLRLAPLLNTVLSLDLPENEFTRQMSGQIRAENTRLLLVRLLQHIAKKVPLLLIIDDAHWLDSASWALLEWVSREAQPVLLILVTRPMNDPVPSVYHQLQTQESTQRIILDILPAEETLELVRYRLGVTSLPETVANLILAKAEGHPFFSEELAYTLRDKGMIIIENGQCHLADTTVELDMTVLPDTIEGIITSRIDILEPAQQLTLKIASVIGRVFPFNLLHAIHPANLNQPKLNAYLDTLERLDITLQESPLPDLSYIFKHIITQEVAYNLMVFNQRQQLHSTVATWYETHYAHELDPWYPLLAYHWQKAGDIPQALTYLNKAGEQALYNGAYQETVRFLKNAIQLATRNESAVADEKLARWHRLLGEAYLGLGQLIDSRIHYEKTLLTLGQPLSRTDQQAVVSLAKQILRQIGHRLSPTGLPKSSFLQRWPFGYKPDETEQLRLTEMARAYEQLAEIYYYGNQTIWSVNAALQTLNLAERAEPSPELTRAYANMVVGLGLVPIRFLANFYQNRARNLAKRIDQQTLLAYTSSRTSLYQIVTANWSVANKVLEQAIDISKQFRDWRRLGESLVLLAMAKYGQGDFVASQKLLEELYTLGKQTGNIQHQAWALNGQALFLWHQGQSQAAITVLEETQPLFETNSDLVSEILSYEVLALAYVQAGEVEAAQRVNAQASALIAKAPPTPLSAFVDYIGVAMVYLSLWESSKHTLPNQATTFAPLARSAAQSLRIYTRLFPVGQTRIWQILGQYYWLADKPTKALRAWKKSLKLAKKMNMPYEQATVHYQIGRHLPNDHPQRAMHLNEAMRLYRQLDAHYDLSLVLQVVDQT